MRDKLHERFLHKFSEFWVRCHHVDGAVKRKHRCELSYLKALSYHSFPSKAWQAFVPNFRQQLLNVSKNILQFKLCLELLQSFFKQSRIFTDAQRTAFACIWWPVSTSQGFASPLAPSSLQLDCNSALFQARCWFEHDLTEKLRTLACSSSWRCIQFGIPSPCDSIFSIPSSTQTPLKWDLENSTQSKNSKTMLYRR